MIEPQYHPQLFRWLEPMPPEIPFSTGDAGCSLVASLEAISRKGGSAGIHVEHWSRDRLGSVSSYSSESPRSFPAWLLRRVIAHSAQFKFLRDISSSVIHVCNRMYLL